MDFVRLFALIGTIALARGDYELPEQLKETKKVDGDKNIFQTHMSKDFRNIVVDEERGLLYVGAVNFIYALDINDVSVKRGEIPWYPTQSDFQMCSMFHGSEVCENTIRVLHSINSTHLYAGGTTAHNPTTTYIDKRNFRELSETRKKVALLPFKPHLSTVSTMTPDGALFAGTIALGKPVISRNSRTEKNVRTPEEKNSEENHNNFWMSDPHFVSAFNVPDEEGQGKVFILMRENAEEISTAFLTQGQDDAKLRFVYSRVVCICMNDYGGNNLKLLKNFATFTKMRIACPSVSNFANKRAMPLYYDEIQNSFLLPNPEDPGNPTIYAIFSTPNGAVDATATCVYHLKDIKRALQTNKYWNKPGSPEPYSIYRSADGNIPGSCVRNTSLLSGKRLTFTKDHPIKFGIIMPENSNAVYQEAGTRYAHIVVDRIKIMQSGYKEGKHEYDVVYYVTENGFIKRVVFDVSDRSNHWELPSRSFFNENETSSTVVTLKIANGHLYAGTMTSVIQLPLASCTDYPTCTECLSVRDPYCAWEGSKELCTEAKDKILSKQRLAHIKGFLNASLCEIYEKKGESDKKSGGSEKSRTDILTEELIYLKNALVKQNETIARINYNNTILRTNLMKCMRDRSTLIRNYTSLSSLILRYDSSRRFAMQLYKNTVFSLHECQHKDNGRKRDELQRSPIEAEKKSIDEKKRNETSQPPPEDECAKRKGDKSEYLNTEPEQVNNRCEEQKQAMEEKYDRLINGLKEELAYLGKERTNNKQNKYLAACVTKSTNLKNRIAFLDITNKNLTRENRNLQRKHRIDQRTNERLRWLHRRHGRRGSQPCVHDEWFVFEKTKQMFHLSRDRMMPYAGAEKLCHGKNATLVILKDEDEIRYIHNLIRAFEPQRHFWVGLKKWDQDTLEWADGTLFNSGDLERFPSSQTDRLTNNASYCVETNSLQRWQLIPCTKSRRVICKRAYMKEDSSHLLDEFDEYDGPTASEKI